MGQFYAGYQPWQLPKLVAKYGATAQQRFPYAWDYFAQAHPELNLQGVDPGNRIPWQDPWAVHGFAGQFNSGAAGRGLSAPGLGFSAGPVAKRPKYTALDALLQVLGKGY